ncbi:MAG TPA: hypothetical protein VGC42_30310 [Kofleriaceae bacterium]
MKRLVFVAAALLAGCDQTDNDRPATTAYVTETILQPSCSQNVCHSSYTKESGWAFDTVDATQRSIDRGVLSAGDPEASLIYNVLVRTEERMPYDAPLPDKDIELIRTWITDLSPGNLEAAQ